MTDNGNESSSNVLNELLPGDSRGGLASGSGGAAVSHGPAHRRRFAAGCRPQIRQRGHRRLEPRIRGRQARDARVHLLTCMPSLYPSSHGILSLIVGGSSDVPCIPTSCCGLRGLLLRQLKPCYLRPIDMRFVRSQAGLSKSNDLPIRFQCLQPKGGENRALIPGGRGRTCEEL